MKKIVALCILSLLIFTVAFAETPTSGMLRFDDISELKQWLATAEGQERYKTIYYDDGSGQNCKDNIDRFIKATREDGILVPYISGQDLAYYKCDIYIPDVKDAPCSVYYDFKINGKEYRIILQNLLDDEKQYASNGYVAYKSAVLGERYDEEYKRKYGEYVSAVIQIEGTQYDGALRVDPYNGRSSVYAIIDGWDVSIGENSKDVSQEDLFNDILRLEIKQELPIQEPTVSQNPSDLSNPTNSQEPIKGEAMPNYVLYIIGGILILGTITVVLLLKYNKRKNTNN